MSAKDEILHGPYWLPLSRKDLRKLGWKPAQIRKILGQPDYECANPVFTTAGAPMAFFDAGRVSRREYREAPPLWCGGGAGGKNGVYREARRREARSLFADGVSVEEIAMLLEVTEKTIISYIESEC